MFAVTAELIHISLFSMPIEKEKYHKYIDLIKFMIEFVMSWEDIYCNTMGISKNEFPAFF